MSPSMLKCLKRTLTQLPHAASAFLLPMTRYMLDAIPDGAEASDGDVATASDGNASAADNVVNSDIPVAVDTPAVVPADDQGKAEEAPAGPLEAPAFPSDTSAESVDAATATSSISAPESSPSADLASLVSPVSLMIIFFDVN